jgi:hypothetical protein
MAGRNGRVMSNDQTGPALVVRARRLRAARGVTVAERAGPDLCLLSGKSIARAAGTLSFRGCWLFALFIMARCGK